MRRMLVMIVLLATAVAAAAASGMAQDRRALRPASDFTGIADPAQRSVALFEEAGKVLLHPRCVNCHPAGDRPTQGNDGHPHQPRVTRGPDGHGVTAMRCQTCHQAANFDPGGVPGNPKWALAPIEMAWQGKSLGEICAQIKDPARNGGHPLAEIVEHMAHDSLVGWAWSPDTGREPAPGTQAALGALIAAWVDSGAACPGQ